MRCCLLSTALLLSFIVIQAQEPLFVKGPVVTVPAIYEAVVDTADYDNDGQLDILVAGRLSVKSVLTLLEVQNGDLVPVTGTGLPAQATAAYWINADQDDDLDVLVVVSTATRTKGVVYSNESGFFTASTQISDLPARPNIWPADYDNDGDDDILLDAYDYISDQVVTMLLRNDGSIFTPVQTPIEAGSGASNASWFDYDMDGDLDVYLAGGNSTGGKIYQNNSGAFTALPFVFPAAAEGQGSWGDVDDDGDPDLLITGSNQNYFSAIYLNNGNTFSKYEDLTLTPLGQGYSQFIDIDHDGDLDVFHTGTNDGGGTCIVEVHKQTETGWESVTDTGLPHAPRTPFFFLDYDADSDLDALVLADVFIGRIYRNTSIDVSLPPDDLPGWPGDLVAQGISSASIELRFRDYSDNEFDYWFEIREGDEGDFVPLSIESTPMQYGPGSFTATGLKPGVRYAFRGRGKNASGFSRYGNVAYAYTANEIFSKSAVNENINGFGAIELMDLDSDGDLDLIFGGYGDGSVNFENRVQIAWNDAGSYTAEDLGLGNFMPYAFDGSDFDRDGDIDILLSGIPLQSDAVTKLLVNNGDKTFTAAAINIVGVWGGFVNWVDVNSDGYDDIYVSGTVDNNSFVHINQLLINNKQGGFREKFQTGIPVFYQSAAAWGYLNDDPFIDLVVSGLSKPLPIFLEEGSSVYLGNGDGTFRFSQELIPAGNLLPSGSSPSVSLADFDKDGDLDIAITSIGAPTTFYWNNHGEFDTDMSNNMPVQGWGHSCVGDLDADGDPDLVVTGTTLNSTFFADAYLNSGSGIFTPANYHLFPEANFYRGGDVDGDGDMDLIEVAGVNLNVLKNLSAPVNTPPAAPGILSVEQSANNVELTFQATDDKTAAASLTINFYLKDPDGHFLYNGISDRATGNLMVPKSASRRLGNKIAFNNLNQGTYEVGIQSIDAALKASSFAVQSFEVVMMPPALASDTAACESTTITVELEGDNIRWFKDEALTIAAGTGNSLDIHVGDSDTTLYAIQLYGTEKGPALPITVKVYSSPTGAIVKTSTGLRAPEGTAYKWYRDDALLEAAVQREVTTDIQGRYKAIVTNGPCAEAQFISYIIHLPVLASDTVVCESNTITLEVTGTNVAWFTDEQLTHAAGTGNSLDVHVAFSDTTLFAVQTIDAEKGPVLSVEIKVFRKPVNPISRTAIGLMAPEGTSYKWYRNDTLLVAATQREIVTSKRGHYKAVVSNGPCDSEALEYVLKPVPPVLTATDPELCVGDDQSVTAAGTMITWYARNGATVGSVPGPETLLLESVTLSDTVILATQTINLAESEKAKVKWAVLDYPGTEINFVDGAYQAPAASTYQWYHEDEAIEGATQRIYTAEEGGVYHVVASNGGCASESDLVTFVEVAHTPTELIVIYNHATQSLYINTGEQTLSALRIYDMSGRHVQEETATDHNTEYSVSVAQLAQAIYIVHVETESGPVYRMRFAK